MDFAMSVRKVMKAFALLSAVGAAGGAMVIPTARAASPSTASVSEAASSALTQMARSLSADQFSFQVKTLRVYLEPNRGADGQPLHIAHSMKVTVRRPDRLLIDVTGDDGWTRLVYDGKTVTLFGIETKKFVTLPVPGTIQGMLETLMGKFSVDLPLVDFLSNTPDKSFLSGVTAGRQASMA